MDIVGFGDCGVWTALGNGDGSFQEPNVVINNFGYDAGGWQVDKHPRFVVDLNGDGCADIVGFGDAGVWTALGNGDGTFQEPQFVLGNYGYNQDWRVDKHPRFLAVLTSSGFPDIVGFAQDGVWVALGNGDGTFREPNPEPRAPPTLAMQAELASRQAPATSRPADQQRIRGHHRLRDRRRILSC